MCCGIFLILIFLSQTVFSSQVVNHRQDLGQTGASRENIHPPLQAVWIELVGASKSYPAVIDHRLYIGTTWGLVCYNARWGTKIWQFISKDFVNSSPVVYQGNVYAGSKNNLYCVDARTGGLKWKFESTPDTFNSSPIAFNNRIYFASGKRLYALDAQTGKNLWSIGFPHDITRPITISGNYFFVASGDRIYGFDLEKHTKLWEIQLSNIIKYGFASNSQHVYVSVDRDLYKIDARTGKLIWKQFFGGNALNPVSIHGNEVFASFDQYLYCVDQSNGRIKWQFEAGYYIESAPIISDRYVWVGSDDYNLYCLDRATGKRLFFAISGSTSYYIAIRDQHLYSLSIFGELFCFIPTEQRKQEKVLIELWIGRSYARIDGQFTGIDTVPFIQNNSTMVPIRTIADFLGANLRWVAEEKKIIYTLGTRLIQLWVGSLDATVNGKATKMNVSPVIVNARTYIPLRFVSENLGAQVTWDSQEKRVSIEYIP